ncbi:MAG: phosphotransferase [Desulfobacula sp.]|jgi:NDP-sugar pyrophosphorylase family protein|uniref:sugar phosphate nucleotidyltransferase n=1 Tax=Desulfobacula sp. TaxID=2593537 RepID=UPI001DD9B0E1|nr:phosphotransferase [Desulfobacula sp.]MBT3484707.1 phosphotransferase [Desulfobacula sp.]MBT3805827.1 phosphotransferase [Desulfobacula sp.]MBT4026221.1 phosphotransferase [Desulfobacula sp.]MBT4200018.1 phosphotransferase [Desulfobacula sp.]
MKALILSAGFGTRLLPYTKKIPKPLFTIMSKSVLEHVIKTLVDNGCEQILINTHHLHNQIQSFVNQVKYNNVKIQTIYESVILDTGGAIANAKPFLKDHSFFVINSDIISSVDLNKVYEFHKKSNTLATLVLHDYDRFNKIKIDNQGYVQNFDSKKNGLAFTGIQVLSPQIYDYFPDKKIFSSIEVYKRIALEKKVSSYVEENIFWSDIGTQDAYSITSLQILSAAQFKIKLNKIKEIQIDKLAGDGSDRNWYRAGYGELSYIISDHGICMPNSIELSQINAFIHIGNYLFSKQIPVPRILNHDLLSGMVIIEDLGDVNLKILIKQKNNDLFTVKLYKKVIDYLIDFSCKGFQGFKKEWTCQTETYSKKLIIEKECQYFWEAFIKGYLKRDLSFQGFLDEFNHIADHALKNGFTGLMHRDLQSRNIMIKKDQPFFIDFQSARQGPLQYDLASLLIDPYVHLNDQIKKNLLQYTTKKLKLTPKDTLKFLDCYHYCCLTRNLQILGAFSYLSLIKKKKNFEHYIPNAVNSLKNIIKGLDTDKLPKLSKLVKTI